MKCTGSRDCMGEIYRDSELCYQHYTERIGNIFEILNVYIAEQKPSKTKKHTNQPYIRELYRDVLTEIENTHTIIIQDYIASCINTLINTTPNITVNPVADIYCKLQHKPRFTEFYNILCENSINQYRVYNCTYNDLLKCVWWRISQSPHKEELYGLLINDVIEVS